METSFQFNIKLQLLNLSNNLITKIEGLDHLSQLGFLDLSNNQIKEINPSKELPKNLCIFRLNENPVEKEDPDYRKKIVVALEYLTELDKIKVIAAERLIYRGLLPQTQFLRVNQMIEQFKRERQEQEAREKMEFDLYVEMMEEQGISQSDRIHKSLDAYQ